MDLQGGVSDNLNGSKNYSIGLAGENKSANLFVNNYKDAQNFPKMTGPSYGSAGANLTVGNPTANASLTATHIPKNANHLTASSNVSVVNSGPHKVDVNAFSTKTFPKGPTPNFSTHGGGVNYTFNDTVRAGASVAHTPMFKHTDYNVSTGVNLMQTPTSSLSLNAGANKSVNPFHNSGWQPGASMTFRKQF